MVLQLFAFVRSYQTIKPRYLNKVEQRINVIQRYQKYLRDMMSWKHHIIFFHNVSISIYAMMLVVRFKKNNIYSFYHFYQIFAKSVIKYNCILK